MDDAIRGAKNAGIFVVVAAGNGNDNACDLSPSQVHEVLTISAIDSLDARAQYPDPNEDGANYGNCVDLFAPGKDIGVALAGGGYGLGSGTSLASPMVAGVAALLYQQFPLDTPDQIASVIKVGATIGTIGNVGAGSPNLILFSALPAPVIGHIEGPTSVGAIAYCEWSAQWTAGHAPYTFHWSGVLSGNGVSVSGQVSQSGYLSLDMWDSNLNQSSSNIWIDVDPTSTELNC